MSRQLSKFLVIVMSMALLLPATAAKADMEDSKISVTTPSDTELRALTQILDNAAPNIDLPFKYLCTPATFGDFKSAYTVAKNTVENLAPYSSSQKTAAYANLLNTLDRLEFLPDILGKLIRLQYSDSSLSALRLNKCDYTARSWANYVDSLNDAQSVCSYEVIKQLGDALAGFRKALKSPKLDSTETSASLTNLISISENILEKTTARLNNADADMSASLSESPAQCYKECEIYFGISISKLILAQYTLTPADLTRLIDSQYGDMSRSNLKLVQRQYTPKTWGNYMDKLSEASMIECGNGYYVDGEFRFLPIAGVFAQTDLEGQLNDLIGVGIASHSYDAHTQAQPTDELCDNLDCINCNVKNSATISNADLITNLLAKIVPIQFSEQVAGLANGNTYRQIAINSLNKAISGLLHSDGTYSVIANNGITIYENSKSGHSQKHHTYKSGDIINVFNIRKDKNGTEIGDTLVGHGTNSWTGTVKMKSLAWVAAVN